MGAKGPEKPKQSETALGRVRPAAEQPIPLWGNILVGFEAHFKGRWTLKWKKKKRK